MHVFLWIHLQIKLFTKKGMKKGIYGMNHLQLYPCNLELRSTYNAVESIHAHEIR